MSLEDKLIIAGGIALVGAVIKSFRQDAQRERENERRRQTPVSFDGRLSERDFRDLVSTTAGRTPRVTGVSVAGAVVDLEVGSISGLSQWSAEIDFNDYGRLTGKYWLDSENGDSSVPSHFADSVSDQIVTRMKTDVVEDPAINSSPSGVVVPDATPQPVPPPAGWYLDPNQAARLRYWDGLSWTGHTAS